MADEETLNKRGNLWQPLCIAAEWTQFSEAVMGSSAKVRMAMVAGGALAAAAFGVSIAFAQEAPAAAPASVDFTDPHQGQVQGPTLNLAVRPDPNARFAQVQQPNPEGEQQRTGGEVALTAGGGDAPVDISLAQRAHFGADSNGDLNTHGHGSEVRVGRNLVRQRGANHSAEPSVYAFVASDDQAVTWQPGARGEFGGSASSVAMQDRVEMGDVSAGVTYEQHGVQASLAYVQREERTRVGNRNFSQDQSFAGVTVTMRH